MDTAEDKVNLPGVALLAYGGIGLLTGLIGLLWMGITAVLPLVLAILDGADLVTIVSGAISQLCMFGTALLSLAISALIAFAGLRMRSLSSPGIVYLAAVLAAIPYCSGSAPIIPVPCCCLGLPIAVWVLITMQDEDVKAAFAE